jgi:hypothetical protein
MAVIGFPAPIFFNKHGHHDLQTFVGCESLTALFTGTAAANTGIFLIQPGIDYLVFKMTAVWTFHDFFPEKLLVSLPDYKTVRQLLLLQACCSLVKSQGHKQ